MVAWHVTSHGICFRLKRSSFIGLRQNLVVNLSFNLKLCVAWLVQRLLHQIWWTCCLSPSVKRLPLFPLACNTTGAFAVYIRICCIVCYFVCVCICVICVFFVFWGVVFLYSFLLQYFDTVGWVFWPVKTVSHITYTVLAGTWNTAQSDPIQSFYVSPPSSSSYQEWCVVVDNTVKYTCQSVRLTQTYTITAEDISAQLIHTCGRHPGENWPTWQQTCKVDFFSTWLHIYKYIYTHIYREHFAITLSHICQSLCPSHEWISQKNGWS